MNPVLCIPGEVRPALNAECTSRFQAQYVTNAGVKIIFSEFFPMMVFSRSHILERILAATW